MEKSQELTKSDYEEIYNQFFEPLRSQTGYYLSFPGFGFWTRDYAESLANFISDMNMTEYVAKHESLCSLIEYIHDSTSNTQQVINGTVPNMCPPFWDKASCFPATEAGQSSVIPCPEYILDTAYDTSGKNIF